MVGREGETRREGENRGRGEKIKRERVEREREAPAHIELSHLASTTSPPTTLRNIKAYECGGMMIVGRGVRGVHNGETREARGVVDEIKTCLGQCEHPHVRTPLQREQRFEGARYIHLVRLEGL